MFEAVVGEVEEQFNYPIQSVDPYGKLALRESQTIIVHDEKDKFRPEASIYVQDEVRPHSFEEALEIHQSLVDIYAELGYEVVEVPWGSVLERVGFVRRVIGLVDEVAD